MDTKLLSGEMSDGSQLKMTWLAWLAVGLAIGPFAIKRVILLGQHDYVFWLTVDYVARCISLMGVALGFQSGLIKPPEFRAGWLVSAIVLLALVFAELVQQTVVWPILRDNLNFLRLSLMPPIPNLGVRAADALFGIFLVALSEELVFRQLLFSVLRPKKFLPVILLSSVIFALVHLTSGIDSAVNAFIYGVLLGSAYWMTGRISISVAAHYLIDLKIYSGH